MRLVFQGELAERVLVKAVADKAKTDGQKVKLKADQDAERLRKKEQADAEKREKKQADLERKAGALRDKIIEKEKIRRQSIEHKEQAKKASVALSICPDLGSASCYLCCGGVAGTLTQLPWLYPGHT